VLKLDGFKTGQLIEELKRIEETILILIKQSVKEKEKKDEETNI